MKTPYLYTTQFAAMIGVHANTIRQYESWRLMPPIPRTPGGYRIFGAAHLGQARLIRSALRFTWLGGEMRHVAYAMVEAGAAGDLGGALEQAHRLQAMVRSERIQAEAAAAYLERWAQGIPTGSTPPMSIGQAARHLDVTIDMLHNWERNGLLRVSRNPQNGYRIYEARDLGRLRVIRTLRHARYSTMAILRMLTRLDEGKRTGLRQALDTPDPDEDVWYATDHWLTTLAELEPHSQDVIFQVEAMLLPEPPLHPIAAYLSKRLSMVLEALTAGLEPGDFRVGGEMAKVLQEKIRPVLKFRLEVRSPELVDTAMDLLERWPRLEAPAWKGPEYSASLLVAGIPLVLVAPRDETVAVVSVPCGPYQVEVVK